MDPVAALATGSVAQAKQQRGGEAEERPGGGGQLGARVLPDGTQEPAQAGLPGVWQSTKAANKYDQKERPGKAGAKEKPLTCGKRLAKFLTQNGVDLHMVDLKAACPPPKEEPGSKAARQISDQSTEALMAAIAALQSLGMPESTTRPFQEIVDSRRAAEAVQVDNGKMLEQITGLRHAAAKRRDAVKSEVEDLRVLLASREEELAMHEKDVDSLTMQMAQLMPSASGSAAAPKRASAPAAGFAGVRAALMATDHELQTPEYRAYRTKAEASGQAPMDPLRWNLLGHLGPLDAEESSPPSKRPCVSGGADRMEQYAF